MKQNNTKLANHSQYLTNDKPCWCLFSGETTGNYSVSTKPRVTQNTVKQLKLNWKYLKYAEHTARREQLEHFFCRFLNTEPISDSLPPHLTMRAVCPSMVFIWLPPNSSRFASFLSFDSNESSRKEKLCSYTAPEVLETET